MKCNLCTFYKSSNSPNYLTNLIIYNIHHYQCMPQDSKVIIKEGYGALFWSMHSKHRQRWLRRHNNLSRHWLNNTLTPGGFSSHQPTFSPPSVVGIVFVHYRLVHQYIVSLHYQLVYQYIVSVHYLGNRALSSGNLSGLGVQNPQNYQNYAFTL